MNKNPLFGAKLEERKKNQVKCIDHPLLRQSRFKNWKANAARVTQASSVKAKQQTQLDEPNTGSATASHPHVADTKKSGILEQRPSHTLPTDFFYNSKETKKQKTGNVSSSTSKVSSQNSMDYGSTN